VHGVDKADLEQEKCVIPLTVDLPVIGSSLIRLRELERENKNIKPVNRPTKQHLQRITKEGLPQEGRGGGGGGGGGWGGGGVGGGGGVWGASWGESFWKGVVINRGLGKERRMLTNKWSEKVPTA